MDKRAVYLPPTTDDERCRQLDLFVWGDAYRRAIERTQYELMEARFEPCPEREDFTDGSLWIDALMIYKRNRSRRIEWILHGKPIEEANRAAIRATKISWDQTRKAIYERDGGICQVCGKRVTWGWDYECGHIIDRVVGGSDRLSNLVCMCVVCNRLKPLTETREEYIAWAGSGGPICEVLTKALHGWRYGHNE